MWILEKGDQRMDLSGLLLRSDSRVEEHHLDQRCGEHKRETEAVDVDELTACQPRLRLLCRNPEGTESEEWDDGSLKHAR